jgi:hypothetical protein
MGLFKKKKQEVETKNEFQLDESNIKKISMFITIVNRGQGNYVLKIFEQEGSNAQFVQLGEGTAQKEVRDILGIEDNGKEIIISLIANERIEGVKNELEAFFKVNKRNRGIGFSIPMTSLIGMKVYQFLADKI